MSSANVLPTDTPTYNPSYTLGEIIAYLNEKGMHVSAKQADAPLSDKDILRVGKANITGIGTLSDATPQQIAFLANPHYRKQLTTTQAGAVLVTPVEAIFCPKTSVALVLANPYLAYAALSALFTYRPHTASLPMPTIHPTAIIAPSAVLGENVVIGAYCVIGEGVVIGDNSQLDSHVTIEDFAQLGRGCRVKSHGFIGHHCVLGDEVTVHSHASIGNEGFGFAPNGKTDSEGWQKIHQLGRVIIGNKVRIGSQTCIDRGALGDTLIDDHVILDNLVQIAHNVRIGAGTAIAACVGIAGSTKVGKRCVLAGGVGLVGHIEICDDVTITGMTMVTKSITQAGSYSSGTPMMPTALWRKVAVKFKQLI